MKKNKKDVIKNTKKTKMTEEQMIDSYIKTLKLKFKKLEYSMDFGSISAKISHSLN